MQTIYREVHEFMSFKVSYIRRCMFCSTEVGSAANKLLLTRLQAVAEPGSEPCPPMPWQSPVATTSPSTVTMSLPFILAT